MRGSKRCEPNPLAFDWMSDTAMRSRSTTARWMVPPSAAGWGSGDTASGADGGPAPVELVRVEQLVGIGAGVEAVRAVPAGLAAALGQQVGPQGVLGPVGSG